MRALTFYQALAKGYPEYNSSQPRNPDGTWGSGGGTVQDKVTTAHPAFKALRKLLPGWDGKLYRGGGNKPFMSGREHGYYFALERGSADFFSGSTLGRFDSSKYRVNEITNYDLGRTLIVYNDFWGEPEFDRSNLRPMSAAMKRALDASGVDYIDATKLPNLAGWKVNGWDKGPLQQDTLTEVRLSGKYDAVVLLPADLSGDGTYNGDGVEVIIFDARRFANNKLRYP